MLASPNLASATPQPAAQAEAQWRTYAPLVTVAGSGQAAPAPVPTAIIPNDTYYSRQWNLPLIGCPTAWAATTGAGGPIVAVLDSGVDLGHPDLAANLVPGYDFVNQDDQPQDDNGHGTHVAGIIAAVGNNDLGITGVAWSARIMPVKVLDKDGSGNSIITRQGIRWAVDNGARIINLSLGSSGRSAHLEDAISYALSKGVLVIAAVGNVNDATRGYPVYPAAYNGVLGVGATDAGSSLATFSNIGAFVGVVAPGASILSTYPGAVYAQMSGTSMATPHVAGLAALIWAANPDLTAAQVAQLIRDTATDLGTPGWDERFGHGLIDVGRAVTRAPAVAAASLSAAVEDAHAVTPVVPEVEPRPGSYTPGIVWVRLEDGSTLAAIEGAVAAQALALEPDAEVPGLVRLQVAEGSELQMVADLSQLPGVAAVYLDYGVSTM